jgi:hypothetical protein
MNLLKSISTILVLFFNLLCPVAYAQNKTPASETYIVAINGNDKNSGSLKSPLKTISYALSLAKPGEIIQLRKGMYHQKIVFSVSGLPGKPIVLKPYKNEKAIIDGEDLPALPNDALIRISHVSWVNVTGLELRNFHTTAKQTVVNGITIDSGSTHILIRKNSIHGITNLATVPLDRSAHAIWVIGNTKKAVRFIQIDYNQVYQCKTGYSENVTVNGYVEDFSVQHNTIFDGENIGIDAAGGYRANTDSALNYARNGKISFNRVYNINNSHGAPGIYVDGARNIIIEHNDVSHCFRGIGVLSENTGYPAKDCLIRYNHVHENQCAGLYIGGYEGQSGGGGTIHCQLIGNVLNSNNSSKGVFGEVEGEIRIKLNCDSNLIAHNIIFGRKNKSLFINKPNVGGKYNLIENNTYYAPGKNYGWTWNGKMFKNFDQWCAASNDQESVLYVLNPAGKFINYKSPAHQHLSGF